VFHRSSRLVLLGLPALSFLTVPAIAVAQTPPAASGAAAQPMTKARLTAQLDASFKTVDTNADKNLSTAEIQAAQTRSIAQAQANINKRLDEEFAKLDGNKDGQLTAAEFRAGAPTPRVTPAADMLRQMDTNKDGKVGQDEYRSVPLGNFDRLDTNKDGTISAQEQAAAERR
jgi:hypothetical protein